MVGDQSTPPGVYVAAGAAGGAAYEKAAADGHGAEATAAWVEAIVDVAFNAGVSLGRTRAAADIREQARNPLETNEIAIQALLEAARIAEGRPSGE